MCSVIEILMDRIADKFSVKPAQSVAVRDIILRGAGSNPRHPIHLNSTSVRPSTYAEILLIA